jgi:hypothetical protein
MKNAPMLLVIAVGLMFVGQVVAQSTIGPDSKPCDSVGSPVGWEPVIYEKGSGWEGYFVLFDARGYVVTSSGYYRLLDGANTLAGWSYITCSSFQTFQTRGFGWRMGFLFFSPSPNQPTVEFYNSAIICSANNCKRR